MGKSQTQAVKDNGDEEIINVGPVGRDNDERLTPCSGPNGIFSELDGREREEDEKS